MGAIVKTLNGVALGWLWLSVLLMPILAIAGGLGFQAAGFFTGVSAILAWAVDRDGSRYLKTAWPLFLLGFVGWAWLSTLWSPYDGAILGGNASMLFGLCVALLFLPFVVLKASPRMRNALIWAVIVVGLLGVTILFIDAASGFALSLWGDPVAAGDDPIQRLSDAEMNLGRGQVSYVQLLWPVSALLIARFKRGWILALAAFLGLMASAQLNNLSVVIPTVILAGGFACIAWVKPSFGIKLAFAFAIAGLVCAPLLGLVSSLVETDVMPQMPLSWEHRVRMWAYSWELIQQAPLFGHGFDSARVFDEMKFRAPDGRDITVMSMHPHNIGLQIWLETGLVGIIFAVAFLFALLKTALKVCTGSARAFAVAGLLATIASSGAVTVGVWQHWWWALIVLAVSLTCLVPVAGKVQNAQNLGKHQKNT
ncbi:MAG: O-antigen ligase family protein [Litorimonas sp.]